MIFFLYSIDCFGGSFGLYHAVVFMLVDMLVDVPYVADCDAGLLCRKMFCVACI